MLSGSASLGCRAYYYYYHCSSSCGARFRADRVNLAFSEHLKKFRLRSEFAGLFRQVLRDVIDKSQSADRHLRAVILRHLERLEQQRRRAMDFLLAGDLGADDYRLVKEQAEQKISEFQRALDALPDTESKFEKLLKRRDGSLVDLHKLHERASVEEKRKLVGMLYPVHIAMPTDGTPFHPVEGVLFSRLFKDATQSCSESV